MRRNKCKEKYEVLKTFENELKILSRYVERRQRFKYRQWILQFNGYDEALLTSSSNILQSSYNSIKQWNEKLKDDTENN